MQSEEQAVKNFKRKVARLDSDNPYALYDKDGQKEANEEIDELINDFMEDISDLFDKYEDLGLRDTASISQVSTKIKRNLPEAASQNSDKFS